MARLLAHLRITDPRHVLLLSKVTFLIISASFRSHPGVTLILCLWLFETGVKTKRPRWGRIYLSIEAHTKWVSHATSLSQSERSQPHHLGLTIFLSVIGEGWSRDQPLLGLTISASSSLCLEKMRQRSASFWPHHLGLFLSATLWLERMRQRGRVQDGEASMKRPILLSF